VKEGMMGDFDGMKLLDDMMKVQEENAALKAAIKWASDKRVFDHFNHPISDKEWEYFVTELKRRSEGGEDGHHEH